MHRPASKSTILFLITVLALITSLVFPSAVFADDGVPPPAETAEAIPPTEDVVITEEGTLPVVDTAEALPPTEDASVTEEEILPAETVEVIPSAENATASEVEASVEETPETSVMEILAVMDDAGVVLADESGNPIPLVTEEAQNALLFPDPIGCPAGVEPVSWGGTGAGCTSSYSSIQSAIDDVLVGAGWTIYIDPGTFVENVIVDKSITLRGSGQGITIIQPAVSDPNCGGAGGGSLCAGASNVILIQADNVTIRDLTIDGNNPFLSSGTTSNGVDVDARNGIITDHVNAGLGTIDGLEVMNVEIENIYLRGIYASDSGTFNIHDNIIENVAGEYASIALMNFGGSGTFSNNVVNNANDGIVANWSTGTQFLNNTITNSGTGIHTDNTHASDVISGNTISNGLPNSYGIFVFAPNAPVSVTNNTITNVDVGLTVSGNGWGSALNTITFDNNKVTSNVIGAYVTTDVWGYFFSDVSASFTNNVFTGGDYGFYLESNGAGEYYPAASYDCSGAGGDCVLSVNGANNSISGQNLFAATIAAGQINWFDGTPGYYGVYDVDLRGNWWGNASGPQDVTPVPDGCGLMLDNPGGLGGKVSECILYNNWLTSNPFVGPTPIVPVPPVAPVPSVTLPDGAKGFAARSTILGVVPPTTLIPVTGGQVVEISCEESSFTLMVNDVEFVLTGLCGFNFAVDSITADGLPADLEDGESFLSGLDITLLKGGAALDILPNGASISISYPVVAKDTCSAKHWDEANNAWQENVCSAVDGQTQTSVQLGVNILANK